MCAAYHNALSLMEMKNQECDNLGYEKEAKRDVTYAVKLSKLVNNVEGFDANHELLLLMENLRVNLHYAKHSLVQ